MSAQLPARFLIKRVLKGVAVAMGVAILVMNILHVLTPETQTALLGIGLTALAVAALQDETKVTE
jgi:hypothetical protein